MKRWADSLNYIGNIADKKMIVYKATYHGIKKDLYYIGKTSIKLSTRWENHHTHWQRTHNILSYIDILSAITKPEDWDIEMLGEATTKNELSKIENDNIYEFFKKYDLNTVLNLTMPRIPSKYFSEIKMKREKYNLKLNWYYNITNIPSIERASESIDLSVPDGSALENYLVPPNSNLFFLFNNYYSINLLSNRLYAILKQPRDSTKVIFTNLDMRFKMFNTRFLRQVRGNEAYKIVEKVKKNRYRI